jgi:siroheme synthase
MALTMLEVTHTSKSQELAVVRMKEREASRVDRQAVFKNVVFPLFFEDLPNINTELIRREL